MFVPHWCWKALVGAVARIACSSAYVAAALRRALTRIRPRGIGDATYMLMDGYGTLREFEMAIWSESSLPETGPCVLKIWPKVGPAHSHGPPRMAASMELYVTYGCEARLSSPWTGWRLNIRVASPVAVKSCRRFDLAPA